MFFIDVLKAEVEEKVYQCYGHFNFSQLHAELLGK